MSVSFFYKLKLMIKKNPFFYRICNMVLRKRNDIILYCKTIFPIYKAKWKNKNIVFLALTPIHGNLGDHAIAMSERIILDRLGKNVFEIPGKLLFDLEAINKLNVMNGNPILVSGGGFLGTLWYHDERVVRNLIQSNPDSDILLFPNTVVYEDSIYGQEEFQKAIEIYRFHKHLKLYAREKKTYEVMKKLSNNVALSPDMVMYLRKDDGNFEREGCLMCLRNDCEKTMADSESEKIITWVKTVFGEDITWSDTVVDHPIPIENREKELDDKFQEFQYSSLVITDRLHGMIFAAITGTPCIVFNSKSPKVLGCYEWIKHLPYIKFCESPEELSSIYNAMPRGSQRYDNQEISKNFDGLIRDLITIGDTTW